LHPLFSKRLTSIVSHGYSDQLLNGLKGIEKESLRLTTDGLISKRPHPKALGSALTHPHITTDYSEALMEMVTPAYESIDDALAFLHETHQFVYQNIGDEMLLATSMPCGIHGDEDVSIAQYGVSNIGRMKHIYRNGLGYRYGRSMQAISGIHFNYSIPGAFWPIYQQLEENTQPKQAFIDNAYMGMIRNVRRYSWLLTYLFGASPAFCQSFLNSRKHLVSKFEQLNPNTLHKPHATSLRMSDIGYQSTVQVSLCICFDSLDSYIRDLTAATQTPFPEYTAIGIKVDGEYRQLNDAILQIENEYYSPVRPKQPIRSCEKPSLALKSRGVRYIELRMLDLNLAEPIGVNRQQCHFLESFLLFCLLEPSPAHTEKELLEIRSNLLDVAYEGRNPGLKLYNNGQQTAVKQWAGHVFESLASLCDVLDAQARQSEYSDALNVHQQMIEEPDKTLSAQIISQLRSTEQSFGSYALQISQAHKDYFKQLPVKKDREEWFKKLSVNSLREQQQKELNMTLTFDEFLYKYFNQSLDNPYV